MTITIIDGQNEEAISNLTGNAYNPCLPTATLSDKWITITFSSNITSFSDWFPSICTNDSGYANVYMFDGAEQWIFNNLIVADYNATDGYLIARSDDDAFAAITCNHCTFMNIESTGTNMSLFDTYRSVHFYNSSFTGITVEGASVIHANHTNFITEAAREFTIADCNITNVVVESAFMSFRASFNEVKCAIFKMSSFQSHYL